MVETKNGKALGSLPLSAATSLATAAVHRSVLPSSVGRQPLVEVIPLLTSGAEGLDGPAGDHDLDVRQRGETELLDEELLILWCDQTKSRRQGCKEEEL